MNKVTRNLMKQAKKRGQLVKFFSETEQTRCPCWSTEFQQPDAVWHEANPSEPICNDEGYLVGVVSEIEGYAFMIPYGSASRREIPAFDHYIKQFGPIQQHDHILIAPTIPENAKRMSWSDKDWVIYNPLCIPIGTEIGVWMALARSE